MAAAQSGSAYPNRALRIIVPFAPGGPADAIARIAATGLQQSMGQPVIVENKAGAGGTLGADIVAKAAPDGYTLLLCNVGDTMASSLYKSLPYDFERDFAPVSLLATSPFLIAVNPSVPAKTLADLVQMARDKPASVTFGSAGNGVASHLSGEALSLASGAKFLHVPYKGQAPAMTDLLGGQIAFMFANPVTTLPYVKSGKLRALAIAAPARSKQFPDVPTIAEAGYPDSPVISWYAWMVPSATPKPVIDRLNREFTKLLADPGVQTRIDTVGGATLPAGTPAEVNALVAREVEFWARFIKETGLTAD